MAARSDNGAVITIARAALREPFTRRARLELLWCAVGVVLGSAGAVVILAPLIPGTAASLARGGPILVLLVVLVTATGASRAIGAWYRRLAARLLGVRIGAPPPLQAPGGVHTRFAAHLRDATSWRATAYLLLKVPFSLLQYYALLYWAGLFNLSYPFWWGLFRNHSPGVHLRPVPATTPFGWFWVATLPGTWMVFAAGAAMVLAAPWVTRAVTAADRWLVAALLGPGGLSRRIRHLEESRAQVVEESATTLRRIERDLHDGTQAQLTALAMKLGQAKEKLEHSAAVPFDPAGALELVDAAHRHAKEALSELRDIARGIHPPVLDVGLGAALATLVARSAVPASLRVDTKVRPSRAIETIAYFSVAELLANAAKHSRARHAAVAVTTRAGVLHLSVSDDGVGGARPGAGSGLTGLADRVRAVDGRLDVSSPPAGPTLITVELPLQGWGSW
jgi:signal transduction histidine kinase